MLASVLGMREAIRWLVMHPRHGMEGCARALLSLEAVEP
jgi:hypothetical protein